MNCSLILSLCQRIPTGLLDILSKKYEKLCINWERTKERKIKVEQERCYVFRCDFIAIQIDTVDRYSHDIWVYGYREPVYIRGGYKGH